eukprot:5738213-Lingulodinium_polyedra.AAC.1
MLPRTGVAMRTPPARRPRLETPVERGGPAKFEMVASGSDPKSDPYYEACGHSSVMGAWSQRSMLATWPIG